ncbi:MAG: hypothetical protein V1911_02885, partial [Candidatus Micrarchaeota archaeon]
MTEHIKELRKSRAEQREKTVLAVKKRTSWLSKRAFLVLAILLITGSIGVIASGTHFYFSTTGYVGASLYCNADPVSIRDIICNSDTALDPKGSCTKVYHYDSSS